MRIEALVTPFDEAAEDHNATRTLTSFLGSSASCSGRSGWGIAVKGQDSQHLFIQYLYPKLPKAGTSHRRSMSAGDDAVHHHHQAAQVQ